MTKDEALKMAIEALETCTEYSGYEYWFDGDVVRNALKIAREALEQPAQEPVALKFPTMLRKMWSGTEVQEWIDKNTHPAPAWQGLSDDEITLLRRDQNNMTFEMELDPYKFAYAIARLLEDKNRGKNKNLTIECAGCGRVLEECEQCCCYETVKKMADRFLYWEIPESVRSDDCVTHYGTKNRRGTNLLNVDEARQMVRHILGHKHDK